MTKGTTKILAAVLILLSLLTVFLPWLSAFGQSMSLFELIKETGSNGFTVGELIGIVLIVTTILGILLSLKGKKLGAILHLIAAVGVFVYIVADKNELVSLAVGSFLCPILALLAVVCICLPAKE